MATLTASFRGSNTAIVRGLCQFVGGQVLKVTGIDLPAITKVYFSLTESDGASETRIGTTKDGVLSVAIPESMIMNDEMTSNYTIYAFIHKNEDSEVSTYVVKMPVIAKPKPSDSMSTDEQAMLSSAIELINEYNDKVDAMGVAVMEMEEQAQDIQRIADEIREVSDGLPQWVKDGLKPTYNPEEVGADAAGTAQNFVTAHNNNNGAHEDIRNELIGHSAAIASIRNSIAGFASEDSIPTELSDLSDDEMHRVVSDAQIADWNSKTNFSGDYNDLSNKPVIPTIPESIKNPNKIVFSGAATGEYDGSEEVEIHVNGASIVRSKQTLSENVNKYELNDIGNATELNIIINCPQQTYDVNSVYLAVNDSNSPVTIPLNPVSRSYSCSSWIWMKKVNDGWRVLYKPGSAVNFTTQNALASGWWDGSITSISIRSGENAFPQGSVFNVEGVLE